MAIQCPVCDLRFTSDRDLDDHLQLDHPDFKAEATSPEDAYLLENRRKAGKKPPRH